LLGDRQGGGIGVRLAARKDLARETALSVATIRRALEAAGVEFIDENGGGPGLRLRKRQRAKPAK
jgi:hypothetical protein